MAFADQLKKEAQSMLEANAFKASVYTDVSEEKTLIRPLLVWWGCQRRYESPEGLYWVNIADEIIHNYMAMTHHTMDTDENKLITFVSDVRFPNEAKWIHEKWDGTVIHLKRYSMNWRKGGQDGSDLYHVKEYDPAPNEEEEKQDPIVQKMADHCIEWQNKKKMTSAEAIEDLELQKIVLEALNSTKFFKHPTIGILSQ